MKGEREKPTSKAQGSSLDFPLSCSQDSTFLIQNLHLAGMDRFLPLNQHLTGFLIPKQHLSGLDRFLIQNLHLTGMDRLRR